MPTLTIEGTKTPPEVVTVLKERLGSGYDVTIQGAGAQQYVKVKQSIATTASIRFEQVGSGTKLHVHGGGLVISRIINEFGIAMKVTEALKQALGPAN